MFFNVKTLAAALLTLGLAAVNALGEVFAGVSVNLTDGIDLADVIMLVVGGAGAWGLNQLAGILKNLKDKLVAQL